MVIKCWTLNHTHKALSSQKLALLTVGAGMEESLPVFALLHAHEARHFHGSAWLDCMRAIGKSSQTEPERQHQLKTSEHILASPKSELRH